jgi:hypothetical protein
MSSIVASPAVGQLTRVGAAFFALWGVLHASVGLSGVFDAVQSGPTAILTVFGGPDTPDQAGPLTAPASGIALDFSMVLAIIGGLAVWLAVMIWRGQRVGFGWPPSCMVRSTAHSWWQWFYRATSGGWA